MNQVDSTKCLCGNAVSLDVHVFNEEEYSCRAFCEDCELSTPAFRNSHLQDAKDTAFFAWRVIFEAINKHSSEFF